MFNVGFKELIEKFEEYFGKTAVKVVLGATGIAFCAFLVGLPIKELIYPLAVWVGAIATGNPDMASAREGISWLAWAVWLACILALIVTALQAKKEWKAGLEAHEKAEALVANMEARTPELDAQVFAAIADMNAAAEGFRAATDEMRLEYDQLKAELFADVAKMVRRARKPRAKTRAKGVIEGPS